MTVRETANAKINLFLDVVSRREDGFHDIKSVMHSVSLCDYLTISAITSNKTEIYLSSNIPDLSVGEDNLIYRSALKYLEYFRINAKINIELEKRIPIGAGLGGGSTDAAATLRGLNKIFGLASVGQLLEISAELGSDVPFCLLGGTAVCTGRGERIEKCENSPNYYLVIAIGDERVSTPRAYRALDMLYNDFLPGAYSPREDISRPYNIFESVTDIDDVRKIKEIMTKNGAESTLMSGSGPSVFGIFADIASADAAAQVLRNNGFTAFACRSVYPEENI